jgi:hypothetical protein
MERTATIYSREITLRTSNLDLTEPIGCRCEARVEADECFATLGLCETKGVRKIHTDFHPVLRLNRKARVVSDDMWKSRKGTRRFGQ